MKEIQLNILWVEILEVERALDENLHPEELRYFHQYLNNPRSLQQSCCIALRRQFKGREIHHLVEEDNLPTPIIDLILFKNILKCI